MMITKFFKAGACAALLLLAACGPKTEYTNALPKDASVVVAMELDQMAGKAGLGAPSGEQAVNKLKALVKGGLQGEAAQLAERMVREPAESGLSFGDKVYFFATPHAGAFAILAKVADESKLEALFEVLVNESVSTPLREEPTCRWAQVGNALCAFNDGTFLLLQPSKGDVSTLKGTLLSWMRQHEGEGFSAYPEFRQVEARGNDIASVVNLTAMPYEMTTRLRMGLSADIRLEDVKYFLTANFLPGKVVISSESLIQNPKVQAFFDSMDQVMSPVGGKYLDYYQGSTMVWMGANVKGKELYRMLCQNPTIRQKLENPILPVDVEAIFSAIEGDMALGCDNLTTGNYLLYADVTNRDFLKTFDDLRPLLALTGGQVALDPVGEDEYLMRTYYGYFWFGVKNNRLYVTTNRTWAEEVGRTYGASLARKPWADEVSRNRVYATMNLAEMFATLNKYKGVQLFGSQQAGTMAKLVLEPMDYLNVSTPDWRQGKAELVLKDKHANLLQLLVGMWNK